MFLIDTMLQNQNARSNFQQLSMDPRQWTREDVSTWLLHAGMQYQLEQVYPERFPMNGKSLLLMTREMFLSRVPVGGGILFEDIQLRLQKVITELYKRVDVVEHLQDSLEH